MITTATQTAAEISLPEWSPAWLVEAWGFLQAYPLAVAAVIVAVSFVLAKISEILICRVVYRLTSRTETDIDDQIVELVRRPIFIAILFFGLATATVSLGLPSAASARLVALLKSIVVVVWVSPLIQAVRTLMDGLSRHHGRFPLVEERTIPLFDILARLTILGIASYMLLAIWEINPAPWLASAGIVGIAVGFAAKDTLANLFSGIFILADAPYKIGDFINLDTGERGMVTHVGMRSTRLLTRDDIEVTIPNAVIANAKIINETGGPSEVNRIRIRVGVAYGSDLDAVCAVLERVAVEQPMTCPEPAPRVRLREFADSGINFELLCWIAEPVLRGQVTHELYMAVYRAFGQHGIEIPYPKRDLYIKQMPASMAGIGGAGSGGEETDE